ncbi:glucose-6-phosphate isomerase [Limnohabitans sp. Bal53]|uniref:glucose-6-phosphate isomerase n=1 Tax=Limnohabitans sp. Bal53 TaxID=1977910 RepID=UPI000D388C22|nr:glucose-6-phosphate isomerase [Limnohabitans sp. Bal53]PUE42883.1 glucose-6-phosphate isomerase [Limnohabitans sp. Bal53]
MRCDLTPAWKNLQQHAQEFASFDLRTAFAADVQRVQALSQQAPCVFADLSKNHTDAATEALLMELACQTGLAEHRDAMFRGEPINNTEGRAVMHWLLRQPEGSLPGALAEPLQQVHDTLKPMLAFAEQVRADAQITDVVNIGIGGSDLGPQMAVLALQDFVIPGKRFHFVSNVDGHELAAVLRGLKAESTLFLIASKTFTTIETMTNARSALAWFQAQGGTDVSRHFAALTTHVAAAAEMGITTTFGFWDWVGGRYSMWSAIGLPVAIAIGAQGFRDLLAGAHAMDQHFQSAPLQANLPVRLGLLDVWYRNFLNYTSRSIAPYHSALRRVPAYLQQLEMESNGKRVDRNGHALPYGTSPVLWGEPGTNGQHAYFQMLHQGTDVVPMEFIAVKKPTHSLKDHHELLLANVIAQAQALMLGQADEGGHKHFPGNRPSTFLLLDELTPTSFGALIALQEHRVFVSGAVWGINSFDQWGVELGKVLAKDIHARMASGDVTGLDPSTAALLASMNSMR